MTVTLDSWRSGDSHPITLERRELRRDATVQDRKWCQREKGIKLLSTLTKQEAECKIATRRFQLSARNSFSTVRSVIFQDMLYGIFKTNLDKHLSEIQDADGLCGLLRSHLVLFSLIFEYIQ